jgi:hypothetical protein
VSGAHQAGGSGGANRGDPHREKRRRAPASTSAPRVHALALVVALALLVALAICAIGRAGDARAAAQAQPVVRVTLDATHAVLVGQQVRMDVVVLVPNFFTGAPRFPEIEAPGATVVLLDDAVNANDTIGEIGYAGVQRTYVVTALQPGDITLPAASITFAYAAEPGKPGVAGTVEIPSQALQAKPAGDATSRDGTVAAPAPVARVTIEQRLDRSLDGIKVGDTVTRTITTFAHNAAAMSIPAPTFTAPEGVRIYTHDPALADLGVRDGGPGGRRVDRVTYAFERTGSYALPAIDVSWVDPADHQRKTSTAPAITVAVAANPGAAPAIAPHAPAAGEEDDDTAHVTRRFWRAAASIALAVVLLAAIPWRRWADPLRTRIAARRVARATSEEAFAARLDAACRANQPRDAFRALTAWTRRAGWPSLAAACTALPELGPPITALEATLFDHRAGGTASTSWDGQPLRDAMASIRRARTSRAPANERHGVRLPALNPTSSQAPCAPHPTQV